MFGTDVSTARTAGEAIEMSKLDWDVEMTQLFARAPWEYRGFVPVKNMFGTQRSDTGLVMSAQSERFRPLQNRDVFSFFDEVKSKNGAEYRLAGQLKGGRVVFLTAQLPGELNFNGDVVHKYIVMLNGHDGSTGFNVVTSPIRPICENTLYAAAYTGDSIIRAMHTTNIEHRVRAARKSIMSADSYFQAFSADAQAMVETPMDQWGLELYARHVFTLGQKEESEMTDRAKTPLVETRRLFREGRGNKGESQWDAYNAVTEFIDHVRPPKGRLDDVGVESAALNQARTENSLIGNGVGLRQRAWNTLNNWDAEYATLERKWEEYTYATQ